jgi:3-hydroxypropanoate dehydrogenase
MTASDTPTAATFPPTLAHSAGQPLPDAALAQLFSGARTANGFLDRPVPEALLRELYDTARMAPTGMNSQPARFVFVQSAEAHDRLEPALDDFNRAKARSAPVVAIVAADTQYYEFMPQIWHGAGAREALAANPVAAATTAERNGWLAAGYLMLAARALGLDVGPMGGFDASKVEAAFFPGGRWRALLLVGLGYGDPAKLHPRQGRLAFEQACRIA